MHASHTLHNTPESNATPGIDDTANTRTKHQGSEINTRSKHQMPAQGPATTAALLCCIAYAVDRSAARDSVRTPPNVDKLTPETSLRSVSCE